MIFDNESIRFWVQTLGRFEMLGAGGPLQSGRKVQKRPLEMLKALVAFGGSASEWQLTDALWPESNGDAAKKSFESTLHRLRKFLGTRDAVLLSSGRVALNPLLCLTDVGSFESLTVVLDEVILGGPAEKTAALVDKIFELYNGPFLKGEEYHWAVGPRERLHFKFLSRMGRVGDTLEREGWWREAVSLYLRVIDIDDTAEEFYLRLMSCFNAAGCIGEVKRTYNRLCSALASTGAEPSAEARALLGSPKT